MLNCRTYLFDFNFLRILIGGGYCVSNQSFTIFLGGLVVGAAFLLPICQKPSTLYLLTKNFQYEKKLV